MLLCSRFDTNSSFVVNHSSSIQDSRCIAPTSMRLHFQVPHAAFDHKHESPQTISGFSGCAKEVYGPVERN